MADQPQADWEKKSIQQLLHEYVKERRSQRRWNLFFRLIYVAVFIFIIYTFSGPDQVTPDKVQRSHVALVDIRGPIFDTAESDADKVATALRDAFEDRKTVGVILRINSPGGSPVQSSYIYNEIRRLRKAHPQTKLIAVCSDICASGAYYVAAAADDIYANPSSLVGSIGVLFNGFGFVDTMQKLGIERRLITSGDRKAFLDPFSPMHENDKQFVQEMMESVHQQFITDVKNGRGSRLSNDPNLFSGLAWSGVQAKVLGLIDAFGSTGEVARDVFKTDNVVNYTVKPNLFEQLSRHFGTSVAGELASRIGITSSSPAPLH